MCTLLLGVIKFNFHANLHHISLLSSMLIVDRRRAETEGHQCRFWPIKIGWRLTKCEKRHSDRVKATDISSKLHAAAVHCHTVPVRTSSVKKTKAISCLLARSLV